MIADNLERIRVTKKIRNISKGILNVVGGLIWYISNITTNNEDKVIRQNGHLNDL